MNFSRIKRFVLLALCVVFLTAIGSVLLYTDRRELMKKGHLESSVQGGEELSGFENVPEERNIHDKKRPVSISEKLNLNTATLEELQTLPGIGETLAKRIIAYREEQPFKVIYDLKKVSGIGDKTFASLRELICVE